MSVFAADFGPIPVSLAIQPEFLVDGLPHQYLPKQFCLPDSLRECDMLPVLRKHMFKDLQTVHSRSYLQWYNVV